MLTSKLPFASRVMPRSYTGDAVRNARQVTTWREGLYKVPRIFDNP
jgi:hypothetical protein